MPFIYFLFFPQTWRRSYDDGDITPTNEIATDLSDSQQGGGTLPRQRSSTSGRSRIIERSCSVAPCAMIPQSHLINAAGDYVTPENAILMSSTAVCVLIDFYSRSN